MFKTKLTAEVKGRLDKLTRSLGIDVAYYLLEAVTAHLQNTEDVEIVARRVSEIRAGISPTPSRDEVEKLYSLLDSEIDIQAAIRAEAGKRLIALGGSLGGVDIEEVPRRRSVPWTEEESETMTLDIVKTTRLTRTTSEEKANRLLSTGWTLLLVADRREGEHQWLLYQLGWQQPGEPPEITFSGVEEGPDLF
ncbi:hypothetical protein [Pseudomonas sp. dw_358]|uniref:hypothetical protein n=1 Tax=Pseudomonas sp. dw_358 TaxID=2720083 RepID=UPI001BD680F3|nr:hypothetical protein [Pseudomonas sp. dw_358]